MRSHDETMLRRESPGRRLRGGFTLIEILVSIAILLALMSISVVGLGHARKAARVATTNSFMQAVTTGLSGFERDHDFLPPSTVPTASKYDQSPMWESSFNDRWYGGEIVAQALMGYAQDDSVTPPDALDNYPDSGGGYGARRLGRSDYKYAATGRSYGPYVELKSDDSLVKTMDGSGSESDRYAFSSPANNNGAPILYFRRDPNPNKTLATDPVWGTNTTGAPPDRYSYNLLDNHESGRTGDPFDDANSDKAFDSLDASKDKEALERSMRSAKYILIAPGEDGVFGGAADEVDDIVITGS